MIILIKSVVSMMIGFILSAIFGIIIIPFFKKNHAEQVLNKYLEDIIHTVVPKLAEKYIKEEIERLKTDA